jgi:hypothetical protein
MALRRRIGAAGSAEESRIFALKPGKRSNAGIEQANSVRAPGLNLAGRRRISVAI